MFTTKKLDSSDKLKVLGKTARFDVCGFPSIFAQKKKKFQRFSFIYPAAGRGGNVVRLFKVLQTNACEGNCFYCANRKDRNFKRISFSPRELAQIFIQYYRKKLVDGLFLSSAIYGSANESEERMFKTLLYLRGKYEYRGYIHYKILPGTDESLIEKVAPLVNRLSINLEAPSAEHLKRLSPTKDFSHQLLSGLRKISRINEEKSLKAGVTTQLVVGATGEKDKEILNLSSRLYKSCKLWRVYYSAFMPILDTPLENVSSCPLLREFRLYQADFLLRGYGFTPEELPFDKEGNLPQEYDPKLAWALSHPDNFPVEVNKADFWQLLRVPGIGKISAKRIVRDRKISKFTTINQLKSIGLRVSRARDFITLKGKFHPSSKKLLFPQTGQREESKEINEQLFLWEEI
ncbi:MAG: putative DNA modification/repair radical SAM protein [Candidatus Aerophobetes bacterium]|nr:putative DNA modification/repair radical SAM protein [Candidatus Aerophobetes bacterium]